MTFFGVSRFLFGFPGEGAPERLGGLDASLNEQVAHQTGTESFGLVIGGVVQSHTILLALVPAVGTHMIVGQSKLAQRFLQSACLFSRRVELNPHGSFHA